MALTINNTSGNQLPESVTPKKEDKVAKEEKVAPSANGLAAVMAGIAKQKGDKVAVKAKDIPLVSRIPTGMFEFDLATGGGFPRARYSIVYGPESSGKTNATYCAIANAQRMPPPCNKVVFVDVEGTFDPVWAGRFGIDLDALIVIRPAYGEEAVDLVDAVVRADDVIMVVVDSLAAIIGVKEIEQSAEKFDVGTASLLIKRMCNKLVLALANEEKNGHTPAVVLINQTRMKIGVMFGNPETMPGGQAMKFYASLIVRVSGKNVIAKETGMDITAFKETDAEIKKAKVQVTRTKFEYDMCVLPHDGLKVGETNSWNSVMAHLKSMGALVKVEGAKGGWKLFDQTFPTLVFFQDLYRMDVAWRLKCQQYIVQEQAKQIGYMFDGGEDGGKS